jgi:hypothetical protein
MQVLGKMLTTMWRSVAKLLNYQSLTRGYSRL